MRLGYTQSAVSQQIAALERLVGGSLFDRPGGPRPVELTPLGKLVLGHARDIIARVDAAGDAVDRFLAGEVGRIDVGTFQSVSNVLLPAIVQRLRGEHPNVDIRLFEDEDNDAGAEAVLAGELDLTFTVGQRTGDLESLLLLDDPFVLVAPRRRAARRALPDGRARRRARSSATRRAAASRTSRTACGRAAPMPTFVFRTFDNGAQLAMVRAGMGWAVMPLLAVDTRDPAIDLRPLAPAIAAAPDLPRVAPRPHAVARRRAAGRDRRRGRRRRSASCPLSA